MAWQDHTSAMIRYGAVKGGIYSFAGDCWAHSGMDKVTKQELETLAHNIHEGKWEMVLQGKGCVVMNCVPGYSMTGKAKGEEGEERPLWHAIVGKKNCLYLAAGCGSGERAVVDMLERKFCALQDY